MPIERLQALDNVEKEIASCIQIAGMLIVFKTFKFTNYNKFTCVCNAIRNGSTGTQQR